MSDNQVHSTIGASSMYRWSSCPGSVRESAKVPAKASSIYAEEGTDAHTLAADILMRNTAPSQYLNMPFVQGERTFKVDADMVDAVTVYVEAVRALKGEGGRLFVEQKFDLSAVHPGCFGTADAVIWRSDIETLIVVDYKHGAGIPVKVENNPQLHYYALGALLANKFPARRVRMVIVQPRCDHPDGPVRSFEVDAIDLLDFKADLKKYAKATEDPNAPLVPGDHCRFCPAAALCPALAERAQQMAKLEFAPAAAYDPALLKLALDSREPLKAWLKAIDEFAYAEAEAGRCPPGYKLVEKRAMRKWRNEGEVVEHLQGLGMKDDVIFEPRSLKSPAQLEKTVKKGSLDAFVTKESSGHTLVPQDDKRPAVKLSAKEEFAAIATN